MNAHSVTLDQLAINTIRTLSMDAVQQANSGHPGTPMALAPVVFALWNRRLRYAPRQPLWPARDRFVLSCGHASMLLYSVLHLAGVRKLAHGEQASGSTSPTPGNSSADLAITLDDIRRFRQLGSPCAGHPEYGEAAGIETTTGPLGQGVATSVGMAMAARWYAARYDRPGFELFDYNVYALCSDGDLMEGIGCEAASLAGHLALANLCWIYDDNGITIEGHTDLAFSERVPARFEALGWKTITIADANDVQEIEDALRTFESTTDRPTLIVVRSVIGYGAPTKANTHEAHGAPLGADEVRGAKKAYGWPENETFLVPPEVPQHFQDGLGKRGTQLHAAWTEKFAAYAGSFPELAAELRTIWDRDLPDGWDHELPAFPADAKGIATRASSGQVLNAIARRVPWLIGGSADLAPSNNTNLAGDAGHFSGKNPAGRNLHFGIREHAMAAISNGLSLSGLRAYGGTFFCFTDYMRPSMRLSAYMRQPVLYILTHDSIGLGEDGPTHQPVEHLAACRAIPGLIVLRPGDANEVAEAYRVILRSRQPVALVLSRQNVPTFDRTQYAAAAGVSQGAYVLADPPGGKPRVILIGTGSELSICVAAHQQLLAEGVASRVVSMPSWELFEEQDPTYRNRVLPPDVQARIAVEAGIRLGWERYLGPQGVFVGMTSYGASAPAGRLYEHFGITAANVVAKAKQHLA